MATLNWEQRLPVPQPFEDDCSVIEKIGHDATMPYHPTLNPTFADLLATEIKWREERARRPFQPWGEIVERIKAKEFTTRRELATEYGKPSNWATALLQVLIDQGVMSREELRVLVPGVHKRASQFDPTLTSSRSQYGGTPPLNREYFERLFLEIDKAYTFDMVVRLVKLGAWESLGDFCREFNQVDFLGGPDRHFAENFRVFLMRERIITAQDWRRAFQQVPWRNLATKYLRERDNGNHTAAPQNLSPTQQQ